MHRGLLEDLRLAMSVFMTGDERAARTLMEEKVRIRDLERAATENHLRRLREGRVESLETSALHLDIVRDLSASPPILPRSRIPCWIRTACCCAAASPMRR